MSLLPPCATGTMWSICTRWVDPAGHAGERVLVAASPTVPPPHRTSHRRRNVPPPPARAGGFGCWRAATPCDPSGQPRSHTAVQLGVRPGRPLPCPRRLLVLRRTACVAPNLLASRGRYCLRLPVRRRTAGRCDAGVGRSRTGRRRAGIDRAGVARSPSATPVRDPRRLLVLRRTGCGPLVVLAPRGRYYQLRSPVLRRTVGARDAGAGGRRSGRGQAGSDRAGVTRSPIATPIRCPRRLLVLRRTAGKCDAGASRRAGLGCNRGHHITGSPVFVGDGEMLLARLGGPRPDVAPAGGHVRSPSRHRVSTAPPARVR